MTAIRTIRGTSARRVHGAGVLAATTLTLMLAACATASTSPRTGQPGQQGQPGSTSISTSISTSPGTPLGVPNGTPLGVPNGTPLGVPNGTSASTPAGRLANNTRAPANTSTPANQQRAEQDAAATLAAFTAPPGARPLAVAPSVSGGVLKAPAELPGTPDIADKAAWWQAVGDPPQVLAWADKHLPSRFTHTGSETLDVTTLADTFTLPPVAGAHDSRQLIIEVTPAGGRTDIRVDAQATWLPQRPASETVPAGVNAVTVALDPDMNVHVKPPTPVTITDQAKVRGLVALIDGLPSFPAGTYSCPEDGGGRLVLTFSTGPARPVGSARSATPARTASAVATVSLEGCEGVALAIRGAQQPGLGNVDGGRQVAGQALKVAGLSWNLGRYLI